VSRPWSKSLQLELQAQRARAVLQPADRAWWRSADPQAAPDTALQAESAPGLTPVQALDAALDQLAAQTDTRQARLQVTLAHAHVHFDVVAGDYARYSDAQLRAIAQGCLGELLGDAAAAQQLRWQLQPDLRHLLLCAVDQALVEALLQAAARHRLRLCSLQPCFCRQWNRLADGLAPFNGVFAVADSGHTLVSCAERGSITALSCARRSGATPEARGPGALDSQVNRLLAGLGRPGQTLADFVLVARAPGALHPAPRWSVLDWQEDVL
jgi:hypothetical protein